MYISIYDYIIRLYIYIIYIYIIYIYIYYIYIYISVCVWPFWHLFWHSFLHLCWHSIWHLFRHLFWHSIRIYLACILTFYLAFYLTYIHIFSEVPFGILSDMCSSPGAFHSLLGRRYGVVPLAKSTDTPRAGGEEEPYFGLMVKFRGSS